MQALLTLLLCFNALHVLNSQLISSTAIPLNENQQSTQTDRSNYLLELQNTINGLQKENQQLQILKTKLKRECDLKFEHWVKIYNDLFNKLQTDIPLIKALEGNISREMLRDEALRKAIKEVRVYLDVLKFKRVIMIGDIQALQGRQEYQTCVQFGPYFGFAPESDVGTRSFGRVISVSNQADVQQIIFERKKVWLEIKRDQETFQNIELKKFIEYYSGYCQRRTENIKRLIEDLKKYPQASGVEPLEGELERLKRQVQEDSSVLKPLENELEELASEVRALQRQYDILQNAADCYMTLDKWHIDSVVKQFENIVYRVEHMDFSEMELNSQPSGPIKVQKTDPTNVYLDSEPKAAEPAKVEPTESSSLAAETTSNS